MADFLCRNFTVLVLESCVTFLSISLYMYMSLHLMHHKAIIGYRKTALLALARMAQNRVSGRLKLH